MEHPLDQDARHALRALEAWKYQGTGNDFVILDERGMGVKAAPPPKDLARWLCDRHFGAGADGVLTVLPPTTQGAFARMHITNADGTVPEMCGNGLRCVALFLVDRGAPQGELVIDTDAGPRRCSIERRSTGDGDVSLSMGAVRLGADAGLWSGTSLHVGDAEVRALAVNVGNPHLVLDMAPPSLEDAERWGSQLVRASGFPEGCNVEWIAREGTGLRVLVYERGVGITLACGTGAVASAFAARSWGYVTSLAAGVPVALQGGTLNIAESSDGEAILRGPARFVFTARFTPPR